MVCWNHGRLWSMKCVAPVKIQCQLVKVYGICIILCKQAERGMAINSGRTCWHQTCPLQVMCGIQTHSAVDVARELDIQWVVHRIAWDQLDYRQVCVNWVQRIPQMMTKLIVWDCIGLSCIHWTCYTDQRGQFWSWNMVDYTKPETRKRMCRRKSINFLRHILFLVSGFVMCRRKSINFLQQRKWKHCHQ